ncbi:MAG TPA: nucleotidyltransferase family protein [Alphaproteobacteria bacterium]|nr:nucleotidyltransferase family protein [Alphaproteobacteria bacterium]
MTRGTRAWSLTTEDRAGRAGWMALLGDRPQITGSESADLALWAERICDLLSPALADHLLEHMHECNGRLITRERADKARLYSRFLWRRQIDAVRLLRDTGVRFVCLKGFALAHQVYGRPQPRIVGDVDLLVHREDLETVSEALSAAGFAAMPIPSRFGFISDSSFLPVLSADGQVALDLHVAPDAWPATRSLTTDEVFRRAEPFRVAELDLLGPAPEHAFFLLVTNIAKDRFGPEGVRKIVDAAMLLRARRQFDWEEVGFLAKRSGHARALAAFLVLLELLGAKTSAPERLRKLGSMSRRQVEQVAFLCRIGRVPQLGFSGKLRREFLLGADPLSVLRINLKRLHGLIRPRTGLPPGILERSRPP